MRVFTHRGFRSLREQVVKLRRQAKLAAIVVAASLVVSLLLTEALARCLLQKPGFRPFPPDVLPGMLEPHPTLGHVYGANFSGLVLTPDFTTHLKTNSLRMREEEIKDSDWECARVLAVGDSFTFGFGLEAEDAWPARLEKQLGWDRGRRVRVLNGAVSAYSLRQIRLRMADLIPVLRPSVVVVGVYSAVQERISNPYTYYQGYAVLSDEIPHLRLLPDGFLFSGFPAAWQRSLDFWLDKHWWFGAHLWQIAGKAGARILGLRKASANRLPADLSPLFGELNLMLSLAQERSVALVLLLVNAQLPNGEFEPGAEEVNRAVTEYSRRAGIPVADPLPRMKRLAAGKPRFRNRGDYHWSPEGQQIAAEETAAVLRSIQGWREDQR